MTTIITTAATTTTTTTSSFVRATDEGQPTWFLNALMTTKASIGETAGAYSLTEHLVTAASNPPMHIQTDEDEAFYILDGLIEFEVDGRVVLANPGSFAFVARGSAHTFRVLSPTARMLVICSGKLTDNLEEFFTTMGTPATERVLPEPAVPDPERLAELCDRAGIALL